MILQVVAAVGAAASAGLLWLRRRVVGESPGLPLVMVCLATVAALIFGTVVQVSGMVLAVPVVVAMGWVMWRSRWRLGDVALFCIVAAVGTALGYLLAAALDPDTGSYGDQGALLLAVLAVPLLVVAGFSARRRIRAQAPR